MGINGINNYSNFINNYRIPSIPSVSVDEVKRQDEELKKLASSPALESTLQDAASSAKPRNDAALEDISITFNKGDDYGYIGKDSDIYSLDVVNAISDMKKDDVLRQYQFFVGSSASGAIVDNSDGVVIPKL